MLHKAKTKANETDQHVISVTCIKYLTKQD